MSKIFIDIYYRLKTRKPVFWGILLFSVVLFALMASRIHFEENIISFFPKSRNTANMTAVYENLKVSDNIVVMFRFPYAGVNSLTDMDVDTLSMVSARFRELMWNAGGNALVEKYIQDIGTDDVTSLISFIMKHLPLFMEDEDFSRLENLDRKEVVDSAIMSCYLNLISPAGFAMKDYIMSDPLGIGSGVLSKISQLNPASEYIVRSGHIFTPDGRTMLGFIDPAYPSGETGKNDRLISLIDNVVDSLAKEFPEVSISYFGGPAMSVFNARQIKRDTYATSLVAAIIIVLFILTVFKRKRAVFLILCPVIYGVLFALAMSWLLKGSISGIAVGAGAAIMGIALSYSIHLLAHQNYVKTIPELLKEICGPLVIGSVTTIGAFLGLLFTSSTLLQDFGLFASLTLLGTMLFCLVFLPQFLTAQADLKEGKVLGFIERISSYPFEKNKWILASLFIFTVVCAWMSTKVTFDSDMMDLTYWDPKMKEAEALLTSSSDTTLKSVMFVSTGHTREESFIHRERMNSKLDSLVRIGKIISCSSGNPFIAGPHEQESRISRWENWWTPERVGLLKARVHEAAMKYNFKENAFDGFLSGLTRKYGILDYAKDPIPEAFASWIVSSSDLEMLISRIVLSRSEVDDVYGSFSNDHDVVIFDQSYFANKAAESINNDFYLILYVSSFLIFFVLWLSYGRLELALLSFLPMAISWIIITGIMGMLGIKFNIVNIILSTFIFGMGDDFSIFIMEGLLYRYKTGRRLLDPHKSAIFFSSFTMIVGIGALVFAVHPALHSIALITILGMIAVVLIAYTVEPVIFNFFVTRPTSQGHPPYTFKSLLRDIVFYVPVSIGGMILMLFCFIMILLPFDKRSRQAAVTELLHHFCRWLAGYARFMHCKRFDSTGKRIRKWTGEPGIIVANHQSSLDIILIAATFPKVKFMVTDWVMRSPLFGVFARFLGYYGKSEGYEAAASRVLEDISNGWSIAIFPEGTRSPDGKFRRFHKGAFYLAAANDIPIIPIVFYGNWRVMPKNQVFNMYDGISVTQLMGVIHPSGQDYHDLARRICEEMKETYKRLCLKYDTPENPYFRKALVSAYLYKGPVIEWYVKIKTSMERNYAFFHELIPRQGTIIDLGCGMGQLDYMLSMCSPDRKVLGIDYDEEKVTVAGNCWMRRNLPGLEFRAEDVSSCELPQADAFIISDMLHYLEPEKQQALLTKCSSRLRPGGIIIVRDSDMDNEAGQRITACSEKWSTKILAFNKTSGELHFVSKASVKSMASAAGLEMRTVRNDRLTSNTIYILSKSR